MGRCREARWLPGAPWYFVTWGEGEEDWSEVRGRAVATVQMQSVTDRPPWTAVYRVRFEDCDRFYLVADEFDPDPAMLDAMASLGGAGSVAACWRTEGKSPDP